MTNVRWEEYLAKLAAREAIDPRSHRPPPRPSAVPWNRQGGVYAMVDVPGDASVAAILHSLGISSVEGPRRYAVIPNGTGRTLLVADPRADQAALAGAVAAWQADPAAVFKRWKDAQPLKPHEQLAATRAELKAEILEELRRDPRPS